MPQTGKPIQKCRTFELMTDGMELGHLGRFGTPLPFRVQGFPEPFHIVAGFGHEDVQQLVAIKISAHSPTSYPSGE